MPGKLISTSFSLRFQLSNNLSMTPSYRSSKLKKSSDEYYFNCSISRLMFIYQFNNFLNKPSPFFLGFFGGVRFTAGFSNLGFL